MRNYMYAIFVQESRVYKNGTLQIEQLRCFWKKIPQGDRDPDWHGDEATPLFKGVRCRRKARLRVQILTRSTGTLTPHYDAIRHQYVFNKLELIRWCYLGWRLMIRRKYLCYLRYLRMALIQALRRRQRQTTGIYEFGADSTYDEDAAAINYNLCAGKCL